MSMLRRDDWDELCLDEGVSSLSRASSAFLFLSNRLASNLS